MQLGLLLTNRCNAACSHCATSCGPDRHDVLAEADILRVMDEAAALHRCSAHGRLEFCISGGEPFLDLVTLVHVVRHGAGLGGVVACQTNGYWASNDIKARQILKPLREAGLGSLGLSVSRFHERYVKRSRVQRALAIAREFGIETAVKCALTAGDDELEHWARSCGADSVEIFPVHPYLREGADRSALDFQVRPGLPEESCPAAVLTVREDGQAYTCCSPGGFNPFLRIGTVHAATLEQLHDQFQIGGRQQILRRYGPAYFAREIMRAGHGALLRPSYADVCDLCCHIASDPRLSAIAADSSAQFEVEQMKELFALMAQATEA